MDGWRHEFKYIISYSEAMQMVNRLKQIMILDRNANKDGFYNVRSMYFDDYYNNCFYENEDGVDPRKKWRIRIYNNDDGYIKLESKSKMRGMNRKLSCIIERNWVDEIINGYDYIHSSNDIVLNRFQIERKIMLLKPRIIVDYRRHSFEDSIHGVRITFDYNISFGTNMEEFFSEKLMLRHIFGDNRVVLEAKFNEYLPDYIYNVIQTRNLRNVSFSKFYYSCLSSVC